MAGLSDDALADLNQFVAELEQRLESSFAAHDAAIAREAAAAQENARLQSELAAARDRESAGAEIFRTISEISGDAERSLRRILEITALLFDASSVRLRLAQDGKWVKTVYVGRSSESIEGAVPAAQVRIGSLPGTVVAENRQIHIPDLDNIDPGMADWPDLPLARAAGAHVTSGTPLRREGQAIGVLIVQRDQPVPFTSSELARQQSFADQAAIAIENARLFNETREALERQTATADILKVIARSPSDAQPVFEAIATSASRLVGAFATAVFRFIDGSVHLAAFTPVSPAADAALKADFPTPVDEFEGFRLAQHGTPFPIPDTEQVSHAPIREIARLHGFRSMLFVPLMNGGVPIGIISVTRVHAGSFADYHVQLLQTFADQAVIAIENARLFNETKEALEQQTATAEVLGVISSSAGDLAPVFDAMLGKAMQLCDANFGVLNTFDGDAFHNAATYGLPPAYDEYRRRQPLDYGPGTAPARLLQGEPFVEIRNLHETDAYREGEPNRRALVDLGRARSLLAVPLLKDRRVVGNFMIFRQEADRFTEKQIALLKQFAAQSVIAIENTRLLRELRASTEDLSESLTYQTGSGNILKVIASSPTEVGPVLKAIVDNAREVCDAYDAAVLLRDGDDLRFSAHHGPIPIGIEKWPINRHWAAGRAVLDKQPVHLHDLLAEENADFSDGRELSRRMGHRCILSVPLLRENEAIGAIVLRRTEVHPFGDKQIALLQTFADQAVIAIGNVRLFEEVQARTRELAASLDDLRTAQDRLVQTEKLASLGQLTAGIAHEIKNPLNFVNNFAALSAELTDELNDVLKPATLTDKIREQVDELTGLLKDNLEKVVQHGRRADSIVKNMLLHSRDGSGDHRPADINALVDESLTLAYHGARAERPDFNVTLRREFDSSAGTVEVFPQEITRVFLNLVSNGFYAVAKRKLEGGDPGFDPVLSAATRDLGDSVEIRIRDNGTGIPPEVKDKMFNPFFTTKPAGEGTGLGLSMSHDIIVKQHGGTIDVETEPGQFSEFRIVLPRISTPPSKNGATT
jgi:two-component system NtrC family sensor kinase